jgi:hypothetical protein
VLKLIAWGVTGLVLAGAVTVALAYLLFLSGINGDVGRLVAQAAPTERTVTASMVDALPPAAQRYFRHAGVVGQPIPRLVRLKQKGRIRSSVESNWMEFEADETYSTNPPAFIWRAYFPAPLMPVVVGRDEYLEGKGSIVMKMLALVPVADEHGDELRAAGLMRYLNEIMWFPAALLGTNVQISAAGDDAFHAKIVDNDLSAEADFFIDEGGVVTNFRAMRFNTGTRSVEVWETPVTATTELGGLKLPSGGSAVWKLSGGDLDYIELRVTEVSYEN